MREPDFDHVTGRVTSRRAEEPGLLGWPRGRVGFEEALEPGLGEGPLVEGLGRALK